MFVPRLVLALLFLVAIGSTSGLIYVLLQRPTPQTATVTSALPSNTVVVKEVSSSAINAVPTASSSGAPLASETWKNHSSKALSLKVEFPQQWNAQEEGEKITITHVSDAKVPVITIHRNKKARSSQTLTSFVEDYEKTAKSEDSTTAFSEQKTLKVSDYDGVQRAYTYKDGSAQQTIFTTKNYGYFISVTPPATTEQGVIIQEIIKTVTII